MATSAARRYGIELELPPEPGSKCICYQPFRMIYINWYGDVRSCCMSTINEKGALLVGNLNDSTLPELWNNAYMHKLRKSLLTEKQMHEMCVLCPMRVFTMESHIHLLEHGPKDTVVLPAK
jgi:radical SAM protein with 4Fe4S-binding SPASM domain